MSRDHGRGRDRNSSNSNSNSSSSGSNNNKRSLVDDRGIPVVQATAPSPKSVNRFRSIKIGLSTSSSSSSNNTGIYNDEIRVCRTTSNNTTTSGTDKHSLLNVYDSLQSKRDSMTRLFYRGASESVRATSALGGDNGTVGGGSHSSSSSSSHTVPKKRRKRIDTVDNRERKRRPSDTDSVSSSSSSRHQQQQEAATPIPIPTTPPTTTTTTTQIPPPLPSLSSSAPAPPPRRRLSTNKNDEDSQKTLCASQEELSSLKKSPVVKTEHKDRRPKQQEDKSVPLHVEQMEDDGKEGAESGRMQLDTLDEMLQDTPMLPEGKQQSSNAAESRTTTPKEAFKRLRRSSRQSIRQCKEPPSSIASSTEQSTKSKVQEQQQPTGPDESISHQHQRTDSIKPDLSQHPTESMDRVKVEEGDPGKNDEKKEHLEHTATNEKAETDADDRKRSLQVDEEMEPAVKQHDDTIVDDTNKRPLNEEKKRSADADEKKTKTTKPKIEKKHKIDKTKPANSDKDEQCMEKDDPKRTSNEKQQRHPAQLDTNDAKCSTAQEEKVPVDDENKKYADIHDSVYNNDDMKAVEGDGEEEQQQQAEKEEEKELSEEEKKRIEEEKKRAYEEKKQIEAEKVKADIEELNEKVKNLAKTYQITRKIGEGTFSTVYEATDLRHDVYNNEPWQQQLLAGQRITKPDAEYVPSNRVALKRVYSTSSPTRLASEVQILQQLRGCPCVAPLITAFRHQDEFFVVMPYIHSDDFKQIYRKLSIFEIKCYFRSLFTGLSHLHAHNYIHRDVKPNNFLFSRESLSGVLIDFGLAERVATPRPPSQTSTTASQSQPQPSSSLRPAPSPSTRQQPTRQQPQRQQYQRQSLPPASLPSIRQLPTRQQSQRQHYQKQQQQQLMSANRPSLSSSSISSLLPSPTATPTTTATTATTTATVTATAAPAIAGTTTTTTTGKTPTTVPQSGNKENMNRATATKRPGYYKHDTRRSIQANRAGTKGFRAPEILLRERYQTGAIDVWSAGVILLCVITGRYPFFLASDDADALIELANIFGFDSIKNLAREKKLNIVTNLPIPPRTRPLDELCKRLNKEGLESWDEHNLNNALCLLKKCLMIDSSERITAKEALDHPFLNLEGGEEETKKNNDGGDSTTREAGSVEEEKKGKVVPMATDEGKGTAMLAPTTTTATAITKEE